MYQSKQLLAVFSIFYDKVYFKAENSTDIWIISQ